MMGGSGAHEYMAPCPAGENEVALAPGYAANVEIASAEAQPVELPPALDAPEPFSTPGLAKVEEVSAALGLPAGALIKALPVLVEGRGMVLVLLRGDHRLNEVKLRNALGADFRQARPEEIEAELGPGRLHRPRRGQGSRGQGRGDRRRFLCQRRQRARYPPAGRSAPSRDFQFEELDLRTVEAGDIAPGGGTIEIEPAIEVGNIFKLGTRYSEPLGATFLDDAGERAADRDGQLRDRPGADRRRGDRAGRR